MFKSPKIFATEEMDVDLIYPKIKATRYFKLVDHIFWNIIHSTYFSESFLSEVTLPNG